MASSSSSSIKPTSISLLFFFFFIFSLSISSSSSIASSNHHPSNPSTPSPSPSPSGPTPKPKPWPVQFHSLLIVNTTTSKHEIIDLWYDWPKGRNFNIIQKQYGELLYDLEWTNGTSFYYTLDDSNKTCRKKLFPVGILTPNWLKGATYVGQRKVDGFLCNVWEKADFIRYFEDVVTKRPVHWLFINSGRGIHVMTFEVGRVLEDAKWQAPVYCFNKKNSTTQVISEGDDDIEHGSSSDENDEFNGGGIFEWFRKTLDN